ncbi:MAG: hypothetical protein M1133_14390 [Armatimonadetes bacterium]|nr:hypothetical protein [Armatimonadota bacterium]
MLGLLERLLHIILHMPVRKVVRFIPFIAIAAVIPLAGLAYFTSRNPIYCSNCHYKSHEPELWRESLVHPKSVNCIDCHATSRGIILRNFSAQPARVNPNCMRCHKLEDVKKIGAPGYRFLKNPNKIRIPHELHVVQLGANCTDCHYNIVHDHREHKTNRPPMEGCLNQCHTADAQNCRKCHPAGTVAPPISRTLETDTCKNCHDGFIDKALKFDGREYRHAKHIQNGILCGYCHSNAIVHGRILIKAEECNRCHETKKPATHGANWLNAHGKTAKASTEVCKTCHQPRFCDACHGIQMPHVPGWRAEHGKAGVASGTVCAKCHTRDSCRACHMTMSKSPHGPGWKSSHGITARASKQPCANCHTNKFCSDCHGVTMPHPTRWIEEHGKNAISNAGLCSSCHSTGKKNDCANCHRSRKPGFHNAADWKQNHPNMGKQKQTLCQLCHGKDSCMDCHKTPMPHASDWMMTHKSHGASFKKGAFCFNCHQKDFCSKCHDMSNLPK